MCWISLGPGKFFLHSHSLLTGLRDSGLALFHPAPTQQPGSPYSIDKSSGNPSKSPLMATPSRTCHTDLFAARDDVMASLFRARAWWAAGCHPPRTVPGEDPYALLASPFG